MMQFIPTKGQQQSRAAKREFEENKDMYRLRSKIHSMEVQKAWGMLDDKQLKELDRLNKLFDKNYGKAESRPEVEDK